MHIVRAAAGAGGALPMQGPAVLGQQLRRELLLRLPGAGRAGAGRARVTRRARPATPTGGVAPVVLLTPRRAARGLTSSAGAARDRPDSEEALLTSHIPVPVPTAVSS